MKTRTLVQNYRDLEVYETAFAFQQAVFQSSKAFPKAAAISRMLGTMISSHKSFCTH